ncbi:MAG: type II toxin-antitoxin system RelB/DinJ family antitoxin [Candidatus Levyibacteriota bacterium]
MNTTSILIKTDPKLKEDAQKTAIEMGISLTSVINRYLKHFVRTKTITFTANEEHPTEFFLEGLREAEEDIKEGRIISFKNKDEVLAYLDKKIVYAKKTKTASSR